MSTIAICQSSWSELNAGKSVSARLVRIVKEKCRGAAIEVAPLLLPLIATMPHTTLQDPPQYYTDMLDALTQS